MSLLLDTYLICLIRSECNLPWYVIQWIPVHDELEGDKNNPLPPPPTTTKHVSASSHSLATLLRTMVVISPKVTTETIVNFCFK